MTSVLASILLVAWLRALHCYPVELSLDLKINNEESGYTAGDDTSLEKEQKNALDNSKVRGEAPAVWDLIEKANRNLEQIPGGPLIKYGDIAVSDELGNADPCTSRGCLWPKSESGVVTVPFVISRDFSSRERGLIESALGSIQTYTCVQFTPRKNQRDYISIESRAGCFSFVGRRGGRQVLSLQRGGCVYVGTAQHEIIHALGFNHEQTRSDRDDHVTILLENVVRGMEHNFRKINTNNLGTPYDYNSVMHYGRYAFSRNREPTIVPKPDPNVAIGRATQMDRLDVERINRLYQCSRYY
ncbi:hatching enzyme 1.2-like isoform X1 [Lepisosteus oculatus]|uniref:hatching enzyme 1.2-like isoform X1 n=1 Tax=Lepisosteus oculatus TaxID=7918 RepID=UPI0035F5081B